MKNIAKAIFLMAFVIGAMPAAAESSEQVCAELRSARIHLVALMGATNKTSQSSHDNQLHAASARLDALLVAMIHGQNAKEAGKAGAFLPVWESFKNTREMEIIPAIQAGRNATARTLALGIQGERMKQMKLVMGCQ